MDEKKPDADAEGSQTPEGQGSDEQGKEAQKKERQYSPDEFKALIAQRDEAKRKLREKEDAEKKRAEEALKAKGEYEQLSNTLQAEVATLKPKAEQAAAYEKSIEAILRKEAEGADAEIAEAIITNASLTFEDRFEKIKSLKEKMKGGGTGNSPGNERGGKADVKHLSDEEVKKLHPIERAKYYREKLTGKK